MGDELQSAAGRTQPASATGADTGAKQLENAAIAMVGVGDEGWICGERPIDQEVDMLRFETAEIVVEVCRCRGGERRGGEAACLVIEQPSARLGNPFVGNRKHERRSTLCSREMTRVVTHTPAARQRCRAAR